MDTGEFIPTRRSLLSRLKSWEDQDSWRQFFDTYWRLIYRVAIKAGLNDATAQDVVQETILSVAQRMPGFKYDPAVGSFKSWLMLVIRRRIADHLRKQYAGARISDGTQADQLTEIPDDSLEQLQRIWDEEWRTQIRQAALEKVKRRVKPEQFQIFDFYVLQQMPPREVAKSLGVSVMQVYLSRHRIGNLLKHEMAKLEERMV
jgi:RNA polymerase sigma-70 factor (ECF subfamily)